MNKINILQIKKVREFEEHKAKKFREKVDRAPIRAAIGTKYKLGLGVAKQKKLGK